jgi:hypothetical protein
MMDVKFLGVSHDLRFLSRNDCFIKLFQLSVMSPTQLNACNCNYFCIKIN